MTVISTKAPALQAKLAVTNRDNCNTAFHLSSLLPHVSDIYIPQKNWPEATLWDLSPISGYVYTHYTEIIEFHSFSQICVCHKMSVSSHRSKSNFAVKVREHI